MDWPLAYKMVIATNPKRLAWIVAGGLTFLMLSLAALSIHQAGTDRARAEATIEAKQQIIDLQARTIKAIDQRMKDRAAETAKAKKEIQALRNRPVTVQEIVREVSRFIPMPGAPAWKASDDRAIGPSGEQGPEKGQIVFDAQQTQSLRGFYLACAEQKIDLDACRGDLADVKAKAEAERFRADLFQEQRDAAVKALKGGSRWQRFTRNGKMIGVGIVLGVAGGIALTH